MDDKDKHPKHHFFVDTKKYETEKSSMTGAEIKTQANVNPTYQLFLEEKGDDPDRAISDGETISIDNPPKHFYAVPPATFGVA